MSSGGKFHCAFYHIPTSIIIESLNSRSKVRDQIVVVVVIFIVVVIVVVVVVVVIWLVYRLLYSFDILPPGMGRMATAGRAGP